jgi:hypothetical protein
VVSWIKRLFGAGKPALSPREAKQAKLLEEAMRSEAEKMAQAASLLTVRDQFVASQEDVETPWAMFEIRDFPVDGQIKVEFNWNDAFIKRINELGFQAETEQDSVQLFFYTAGMRPTELTDDEPVVAAATPNLGSPLNRIQR